MQLRASVKVTAPEHPRTGEAGYVVALDDQAGTVAVQLDLDPRGHVQVIPEAELEQLGTN